MKRKQFALTIALAMALSCWTSAWAADTQAESVRIDPVVMEQTQAEAVQTQGWYGNAITQDEDGTWVVTLEEGKGTNNWSILDEVIQKADGKNEVKIRIASAGTYRFHRVIRLRSCTTLDLNGATFTGSKDMNNGDGNNIIQVCDMKDNALASGYTLAHDITVKNGTLDGQETAQSHSKKTHSLVNVGHSTSINFYDMCFKSCYGSHLIELTGCQDCVIDGCTFEGYIHNGDANECAEAIQLDICYNNKANKCQWNGKYVSEKVSDPSNDGTPCKNIIIRNCAFKDYPSGVGNHHSIKGKHNSGIQILNNQFINTVDYAEQGVNNATAIWFYCFDDSEISGNTITGKYQRAIRVNGGSVKVNKNTIGSTKSKVDYPPIYVTYAQSFKWQGARDQEEKVTGGTVDGNKVYTSCSQECAISVMSGSKLSSVSSNTIVTTASKDAIYISNSTVGKVSKNKLGTVEKNGIYATASKLTNVDSNTIDSAGENGIKLTSKSTATSINSNVVKKATKDAITLTGTCTVKSIDKNTLTATGNGIYVTGSKTTQINSNKISKCGKNGIQVTSSGTVTKVQSNTVTSCKGYGVQVSNKEIKNINITSNTLTGNKKPLSVSAKGTIQKK